MDPPVSVPSAKRTSAARDCCGRPWRRSAGDAVRVARVARRRKWSVPSRPGLDRQLIRRDLADRSGPGVPQALDHGRVVAREIVEQQSRMTCGRDAGNVEEILGRVGNAVQRAAIVPIGELPIGLDRLLQCPIGGYGDERIEGRIEPLDPLKCRAVTSSTTENAPRRRASPSSPIVSSSKLPTASAEASLRRERGAHPGAKPRRRILERTRFVDDLLIQCGRDDEALAGKQGRQLFVGPETPARDGFDVRPASE